MSYAARVRIRDAVPSDAPEILAMIGELAAYERLAHEARATVEDLQRELFGTAPIVHAVVAERDGAAVGFALYVFNFSTFVGRRGLYLEDLFVRPQHRGRGIGRALLAELAARALAHGCGRMEWSVLDWNEGARRLYHDVGARAVEGWTLMRMTATEIAALAATR